MKTFKKTILVLMAVAAVSLTSCKKDDDGGGGGGAVAGKITAKVDGASFESSEMVTTATRVNANGLVVINLFGSNLQPESKTITMTISGVDGTGTYPIDGNAGNVFTNASYTEANASGNVKSWMAPFDNTKVGEVKISVLTDTKIEGSFSFKAKNTQDGSMKDITNGFFNIEF